MGDHDGLVESDDELEEWVEVCFLMEWRGEDVLADVLEDVVAAVEQGGVGDGVRRLLIGVGLGEWWQVLVFVDEFH